MSSRAIEPLKDFLSSNGIKVNLIEGFDSKVDPRISTHADLYMCQLGIGKKAKIFMGDVDKPEAPYPNDAIYNGTSNAYFFIHNLEITDPKLLEAAKAYGLEPVHVKQGYSRCSCVPVNDTSFLTSDVGMGTVLSAIGAGNELIETGHILLDGFPYGFIGGTCGNVLIDDQPTLVFNGDLSKHPDFKRILRFAFNHGVDVKYFEGYPLEDIGSILYSYK